MDTIETNWYVITGGPSSGKTTLLEHLKAAGYSIVPEAARTLIDREVAAGKTIQTIRADEIAFQRKILQIKLELEERLSHDERMFFDRGIPDSIAYYYFYGDDATDIIKASLKRRYKRIFFLEQVPFEKDYARVESPAIAQRISDLLRAAYQDLGYEVITIPLRPVAERAAMILKYL